MIEIRTRVYELASLDPTYELCTEVIANGKIYQYRTVQPIHIFVALFDMIYDLHGKNLKAELLKTVEKLEIPNVD